MFQKHVFLETSVIIHQKKMLVSLKVEPSASHVIRFMHIKAALEAC